MRRGQPGLVLDALREASEAVQVLVTSHSPALLDTDEIDPGLIRAVVFEDGKTVIGPVDAASRTVLERHLYTAGELLRMNQLRPLTNGAASDQTSAVAGPGQAGL